MAPWGYSDWNSTAATNVTYTTSDSSATGNYSTITWYYPTTIQYVPSAYGPRSPQEIVQLNQQAKERDAAVAKAEELLKEHIGPKRYSELHKTGYIELDSQRHQGKKYRVPAAHREEIEIVDEHGKVIDRLCIHTKDEHDCPAGDQTLARIILLEAAEDYVLATANDHRP